MPTSIEEDFGFIAHLMAAGDGEQGLTECLGRLLRETDVREIFLRDVLGAPLTHCLHANVRTEDREATASGVPDLSIRCEGNLYILVENKVGAPFTEGQPHKYLTSLVDWRKRNPGGLAMLVIQVPEKRISTLEAEAWRRIEEHLGPRDLGEAMHTGVLVKVISWSRTVAAFNRAEFARPILSYFLRSFQWMARVREEETTRMITDQHLANMNKNTFEALAAAEDHLRDLRRALSVTFGTAPDVDKDFTYQGFSIYPCLASGRRDDLQLISIVLSARFAARFGTSLFVMQLVGDDYVNVERVRASGRRVVDAGDAEIFGWVRRPVISLPLIADLDPVEQIRGLVAEIEAISSASLGRFSDLFRDAFDGERETTKATDLAYSLAQRAGLPVDRVYERRAADGGEPELLFHGIDVANHDALLEQLRSRAGAFTLFIVRDADATGLAHPIRVRFSRE